MGTKALLTNLHNDIVHGQKGSFEVGSKFGDPQGLLRDVRGIPKLK